MRFVKIIMFSLVVMSVTCFRASAWNFTMDDQEKKSLLAYGWLLGEQIKLKELELTSSELDAVIDGIKLYMADKPTPVSSGNDVTNMQKFLENRYKNYQKKKSEQNAEISKNNKMKTNEFIAELEGKKDIKKTKSGLLFFVKNPGNDNKPKSTDTVLVHYIGKLINGDEFDSSVRRGTPAQFRLDQVVAGFSEGLQQIGEGGEATLYIPAELGYGNHDIAGIPPGSMIIFDVSLIKIVK